MGSGSVRAAQSNSIHLTFPSLQMDTGFAEAPCAHVDTQVCTRPPGPQAHGLTALSHGEQNPCASLRA